MFFRQFKKLTIMKLSTTLLFFVILYSFSSFASHSFGGTIYWKCVDNGKFQFFLEYYRDCSGISVGDFDETMGISGTTLPTDINNNSLSSITMKYIERRDLSPKCSTTGSQFSCADGDKGAIEQLIYRSDTIVLKGKPPRSGWTFYWNPACCRPTYRNTLSAVGGSNSLLLRAIMFSYGKNKVDSCYDSSPEFIAPPTILGCRGTKINYLNSAKDNDFDELRYSWTNAYNGTPVAPVAVQYANGYGAQNPTPDGSFNAKNLPSSINTKTGRVSLAVHNGVGVSSYLKVVKVDAYRRGFKIASIYRELPYSIVECDQLADSTPNNNPQIYLDSIEQNSIKLTVSAGDTIQFPVRITDLDTVARSPQVVLQEIKLWMVGDLFALDLKTDTNCLDSNLSPCATFNNLNPKFDTSILPNQYSISDTSTLLTNFIWETNCGHLNSDGSAKTYFFFLKVQDDHCSVPGENAATIEIVVVPDSALCGLTTSIKTPSFKEQLNFYPNPTNGNITISLQKAEGVLQLQVRNMHGQLVKQQQFLNQQQLQIELEGKAGIYFLQLTNENGERANLKVVKQ